MRRQSAPAEPWVGERERGAGPVRTCGGREAGTVKGVAYGERTHWDRPAGSCGQTEVRGSQGGVRTEEAGPLWLRMEKVLLLGTVGAGNREEAATVTERARAWLWRRTDETHMSPEKTRTRGHRGTQTSQQHCP